MEKKASSGKEDASCAQYAAHSSEKMHALATQIVGKLGELASLEKALAATAGASETVTARMDKCQREIIPLLESAILYSPNDQTMRIVYNEVYCKMKDYDLMRASLVRLSVAFGQAWSRKESTRLIPVFIHTYNVDTSLLVKKVDEFSSLNEFFYRDINVKKHRPLETEAVKSDISVKNKFGIMSSMADSNIMVFRPWSKLRGLVVKNKIFTVEAFLGGDQSKVEPMGGGMEGGTIAVVRLHPRHIHRAYAPLDAKVTGIWRGGYAYHTTKIVGIENPDLDTLSENKRAVVTFESEAYGVFHVVFVGGPLIGSMVINVKVGESVKRGAELARFEYGGSAIYMCFPKGFAEVEWEVPMNEVLENSVEVQLRSTIGKVRRPQ